VKSGDAPRWRRYLRFFRSNIRADVDDEFQFHIHERIDDLVAQGMAPSAARDAALKNFGDIERFKSNCRVIAEEQEAQLNLKERLTVVRQDAGYALRIMRANPGFTAAIALTLALGIGATTSIFSVINAVLLRPMAYDHPERVVFVSETYDGGRGSVSVGHFTDWSTHQRSFEHLAAWQASTVNLTDGDPARVVSARVTPAYFSVFHMTPALGRYFLPTETAASRVVVLSYPLWESRFARDSAILGRTVSLGGDAHTVVGVTPKAFTLTSFEERLWTPLTFTPAQLTNYGAHSYTIVGKMKEGVTIEQATADIARITDDIKKRIPTEMARRGSMVTSVAETLVQGFRRQLWVLFGAVTFVLLIGCVNVASLLLARAMTRRKEIAVRSALGGSRGRLVGQLLTESGMLAIVGGALALGVAQLGISFLKSMGPSGLPRLGEAGLDPQVLTFALGATLLCGMLFGLAPALRATRVDLQGELRDGGRGTRSAVSDRLRGALIVSEIAVALVLLVSAGLFIRSAMRLGQVQTGFDPSGATMMRVALPATQYDSNRVVEAAFSRLVEEMRAIPGVQYASAGTRVPMWGGTIDMGLRVDGKPFDPKNFPIGHVRLVTPSYFESLGMTLKQGRLLRESDIVGGAPWVIVVNETFVKRTFPDGSSPIGRRVMGWASDTLKEWREIVGVVGDVRAFGREADIPPEVYMPHTQAPSTAWNAFARRMTLVVKARPGAAIVPAMRAAVRKVDPLLPVFDVQTMEAVLSQSTATRRFNTLLLTFLGATGLILAAIGIYGVIAFFVTQRTHEIGVRVALGASTANVVGIVVRQALVLAILGIIFGGVAAYWATSTLGTLLFEVNARDPVTFTLGAVVLLLVALGAAWIPARRASRVAPITALASSG
jgi:putative ABC transport system permease protein